MSYRIYAEVIDTVTENTIIYDGNYQYLDEEDDYEYRELSTSVDLVAGRTYYLRLYVDAYTGDMTVTVNKSQDD